jgi:tetratricopeptide (TPR) repeat protein
MRLSYALSWVLISFFIFRNAAAQQDFIQEYIISGKTIEVVFGAYGFTDSEWIGRCEPEIASKLCGKKYTGNYNKELRTWEFSKLDEDTGNVEIFSSQALTKGDPVNYRILIWDEEFTFDEKGNVVHSGDGKVAHISPGELTPIAHRPETDEIGKTDIRNYRQEGIDFLQDYDYQKAIESFDKALEANPIDKVLYFYRGYSYLRLEEYEKAVADLEKATILDQTNADAFSSLAAAYLELKEYEDVIRTATKAIILNPKDAASYFNRGIAYNFTHKFDKAYSDFSEVVSLEPTNDDAIVNRDLLLKKVQSE